MAKRRRTAGRRLTQNRLLVNLGFRLVDRNDVPQIVWKECINWYIFRTAWRKPVLFDLDDPIAADTGEVLDCLIAAWIPEDGGRSAGADDLMCSTRKASNSTTGAPVGPGAHPTRAGKRGSLSRAAQHLFDQP